MIFIRSSVREKDYCNYKYIAFSRLWFLINSMAYSSSRFPLLGFLFRIMIQSYLGSRTGIKTRPQRIQNKVSGLYLGFIYRNRFIDSANCASGNNNRLLFVFTVSLYSKTIVITNCFQPTKEIANLLEPPFWNKIQMSIFKVTESLIMIIFASVLVI